MSSTNVRFWPKAVIVCQIKQRLLQISEQRSVSNNGSDVDINERSL